LRAELNYEDFDPRSFYEIEGAVTRRYDSQNFWEMRYHQKKAMIVYKVLKSLIYPHSLLLDAGCGSGELSIVAKKLGAQVTSLDISKSYLKRVSGVGYRICASLEHLPIRQSAFDIVLCADALEHVPAYDNVVAELYRVSKRVAVITTPCKGIIRGLYGKLFPRNLARIDSKVGHIHILPLSETRQKLTRPHWSLNSRSYHVIQPISDKFISKRLVTTVNLFEKVADVILPEQGTISLVVATCKNSTRNSR
jgi:ubiquinone/menaquinone biosynthesis C-methylase UbiE